MPTSPVLVTHREQAGLIGEFREQAAALHNNGLRNHDDTGHHPDEDDALASPLGCALEHQWVADSVPAVLGNAAQSQDGHRHRDCLGN